MQHADIFAAMARHHCRPGRTQASSAAEREAGFVTLANYRDGRITLGRFAGTSGWERHPVGDEIVQVIEGNCILSFGRRTLSLRPGQIAVVPRGAWHHIDAPLGATILFVTPLPTEHDGEGMVPQDPFENSPILSRLLAAYIWLDDLRLRVLRR